MANANGKKSNGRKTYSDEIKETARARYELGESLSKIARSLGVAKSTLHSWLNGNGNGELNQKHQEAREDQKQRFIRQAWDSVFKAVTVGDKRLGFVLENADTIDQAIKAVTSSELNNKDKAQVLKVLASLANVPLRDLAIYIGTVYDKIALASGEPTAREEVASTVNHKTDLSSLTDKELEDLEHIVRKATIETGASDTPKH